MAEEIQVTLYATATFTESYTVEVDEQDYKETIDRAEEELGVMVHKLSQELEEKGFDADVKPNGTHTRDSIATEWLTKF